MPEGLLHLLAGLNMVHLPEAAQGLAVCHALRRQVEKLGLSIGDEPIWSDASFSEQVDPYTGETSVTATWRGKQRYGTATFFPDGRVFADYQVLLPHPTRDGFYVESVQVWGRPEQLRGDPVITAYMT
jgi:predicted amidohydrolase